MLGWLYLVAVVLAVVGIVYLDRGSVGRGHIAVEDIGNSVDFGEVREPAPSS